MPESFGPQQVDQFILDQVDSVPHLEALLLLWRSRPKAWSLDEMAQGLFVDAGTARVVLQDLAREGLIVAAPGGQETYKYAGQSEERNQLIAAVDATYRKELIRLSRMIHSKAAPAVREFARAFRFTKERE